MRSLWFGLIVAVVVLPAAADDKVVNTPTVVSALKGVWELQPKEREAYKQRLSFDGSRCGDWQQSERTLPVSTTFYVEGGELLVQHDYEPNVAFNYRLKQLRFIYKLDGDALILTQKGVITSWKRVGKPDTK